ncbi:hypothetical protein E5D57_013272 [Metarhizium anisopliae]|nr:hypothetical protein E5D57_013272 [Metarhizium anisopliae]
MLLSTAGLFLLGALQPALSQPTLDQGENKLVWTYISPLNVMLRYEAKDIYCASHIKRWVGVWSADAPLTSEYKTWQYLDADQGQLWFTEAQLGPGEWKVAFVCEDGLRRPFISGNFELGDGTPPPQPGKCAYKRDSQFDDFWSIIDCDKVFNNLCRFPCTVDGTCEGCDLCKKQCNIPDPKPPKADDN